MSTKFTQFDRLSGLTARAAVLMTLLIFVWAGSGRTAGGDVVPGVPSDAGAPRVVSSSPQSGDTDVDPGLGEMIVTFDRDMGAGFSWTGGGPEFPGREDQSAKWKDKRTCVLPIKLQTSRFYRVGINAPGFQNFRSAEGVPVVPTAIFFTTRGASDELKRKATKPMIVGLVPRNGARDVDPTLSEVRVTFNVPMGSGFSWTGGGPLYPPSPEGKKPYWSEDHKTCILPVKLQPGSDYRLGINSASYKSFRSVTGVPLDPVVYSFRTRG